MSRLWLGVVLMAASSGSLRAAVPDAANHRPSFESQPIRMEVQSGDDVILPCRVAHLGTNPVVWQQGKRVLTARHLIVDPDPRISLQDGFGLMLRNVSRQDAGQFTCSVSSKPMLELTHYLNVLYPPEIEIVGGKKIGGFSVLQVQQDSNITIQCRAHGNPPPKIYWRKQGGNLVSVVRHKSNGRLEVYRISRQMAGLYQCVAENGIGPPSLATLQLTVQYHPEVEAKQSVVYSGEGRNVELVCLVRADPEARVTWDRSGLAFDSDRHFSSQEGGTETRHVLVVQHVRADDFGQYTCQAHNQLGSATATIELTGVPRRPVITSGPFSTAAESYRLDWQVVSYCPVTEYRVAYSPDKGDEKRQHNWKEVLVPARVSSGRHNSSSLSLNKQQILLTRLSPSTAYLLRIQGRNHHGWGPVSKTVRFSTISREEAMESRSASSCPAQLTCTPIVTTLLILVSTGLSLIVPSQ